LAIPAISCGVFGFPVKEAAAIAVREIQAALVHGLSLDAVTLVAFEPDTLAAMTAELRTAGLRGG
jgi:O-acetyl-ADP-ribose deacetylase (regulator of RNase III)